MESYNGIIMVIFENSQYYWLLIMKNTAEKLMVMESKMHKKFYWPSIRLSTAQKLVLGQRKWLVIKCV